MDRSPHLDRSLDHETRSTGSALAAAALCAAAGGAAHGFPPLPPADVRRFLVALLGILALTVFLELVVDVRRFGRAVPLADDVALPPERRPRERLFLPGLFGVVVVPTLVATLVWGSWVALLPLVLVAQWGAQALAVALWERRNGRVLWRAPGGPVTSPVSPRPPTRTATGAPPA
ncbi:hypothetical protein ACIGO6_22325 [Streptomyces sp. NPDC053750]|uniref:hypothetical protein n=1 Tax=Streptomyces sp. NPDC053750 TaxID=3365714 RepID=UPI0037CFF3EB